MISPGRCYDCFRPVAACFCAAIPRIDNQTDLLILQHRREQFHPFNTARIVHKALRHSELLADRNANLAERLRLQPGAVLLYPSPTAPLISEMRTAERPAQLVVVDGTWHHAKTLVRDIPALAGLPRVRLAPSEPGRYRIRLEPNAMALSTVEAVVAALRVLEPETRGFDELLDAFDTMVEAQLPFFLSAARSHFTGKRRPWNRIPRALHGSLDHLVVAYGEASPGVPGLKRADAPPVSWVAERLGDGARFACMIQPSHPLSDAFLGHLELSRCDFAAALPLEEAKRQWLDFQRPGDLMTVLRPGTARLISHLGGDAASCLVLKSIDLEAILGRAILAENSATFASASIAGLNMGRSARRLAETIAHVRQLNALASSRS